MIFYFVDEEWLWSRRYKWIEVNWENDVENWKYYSEVVFNYVDKSVCCVFVSKMRFWLVFFYKNGMWLVEVEYFNLVFLVEKIFDMCSVVISCIMNYYINIWFLVWMIKL